jgi:hypothetical protein
MESQSSSPSVGRRSQQLATWTRSWISSSSTRNQRFLSRGWRWGINDHHALESLVNRGFLRRMRARFRCVWHMACHTNWNLIRGRAANRCYCTVIDIWTTSSPAESHPALPTRIPTCTVYGETPVRELRLSWTAFRPHYLLFYNTNLSTLNPCNSTKSTLHVLTNCQQVSIIMMAKSNHVATVVASINLPGRGSLVIAEIA